MQITYDILGDVIKTARQNSDFTVEALAAKIGISERHLYRIENEGQKPSFDVLFKLIRELSIDPNKIFYPEKPSKDSELENLIRMLCTCDEQEFKFIKAIIVTLGNIEK